MKSNENSYRSTGRALFLAAIMMMSIFAVPLAFSGIGAASVGGSGDLNDEDVTNVKAGASADYQEVTLTITDLDEGDNDELALNYENATDADGELLGASATSNNTNVSVSADTNDDIVTVSVDNDGGNGTQDVIVTVGIVHGLSDVDPVVDVAVPITNETDTTLATLEFNVSGVDVDQRSRAYEGQFIQYVNSSIEGDDVELIRDFGTSSDNDNEFIDVEAVSDGIVYFDTTGLETGSSYSLINTDDGDNELGSVQLTQNRYSAEWASSEVEDAGDTTVDAEIDANRGSYTIYVTSDDLDGEEIFELFENDVDNLAEAQDGVVLYDIRDGDYEADFEDVDTGEYDFEFDMVDTVATDSSSITVVDGDDDDLVFVEQNVDVTQGDIAEIEIEDVGGVDSGYLVVGGMDDAGYEAVIEITDIDDDSFIIEFNTYLAGSTSEHIATSDDATVEVVNFDSDNQDGIDGILDVGDYDLSLGTASIEDPSDEDDVQSFIDNADEVGALFVEDRNVGGMTLWTASSSNAEDLEDADDIADAIENGLLTETDGIAFDDALVHQIEIDGLGGFFEGVDEDDLDEALLELISGDGTDVDDNALEAVVALNIEQTDDSRQSNRRAKQLNTSELDADDIGVIYEGGELFVTIESVNNDLNWTDSSGGERTVRDGDVFTAELEILDQRLLEEGDDQDPYTALVEDDEDDSLVIGGEEFSVSDREGEFINLNDEDEIEVEAASGQDITASTNVAPGTEFTIRTSGTGDARFVKTVRELTVTTDGEIVGEFDFSDRAVDEEFTAQLRGGSLADDRPEADGIMVESLADEPADDEEEPVDDEEEPADDEEPVDDDEEPVDDDEAPADDETADDTTDDETPGFGVLVALVALLGAALLATRRQN